MIVAMKLSAPNDTNGNPRRLYIVNEINDSGYAERLDVIDEGYAGRAALTNKYPDAVLLQQEITVAAAEYKKWIKVGENDKKLRDELIKK